MSHLNTLLAFTSVILCACNSMATREGRCTIYLRSLAAEDPVHKAERVARAGVPYLLGVRGYTLSFPGADDVAGQARLGRKILEGTSDVIEDESCWAYQSQAREYAKRFNRKILELTTTP